MATLRAKIRETENTIAGLTAKIVAAESRKLILENRLIDIGTELSEANVKYAVSGDESDQSQSMAVNQERLALCSQMETVRNSLIYLELASKQHRAILQVREGKLLDENRSRLAPLGRELLPEATRKAQRAFAEYIVIKGMEVGGISTNIETLNPNMIQILHRSNISGMMSDFIDEMKKEYSLENVVI